VSDAAAGRWVSRAWVLLVASSALYFLADNEADNDLWIHVRVGLDVLAAGIPRVDSYSYTAAGGAWIDHEWLLHALFGGLYRVAGGAVPRVDDLSYTAAGSRWVDHEWLSQAVFATAFDAAGSRGLWLCKLAVALLTAWLVWHSVAARSRSAWVRGPVLVLVLATLARGYAIRPQIITYLGVAALLASLDRLDDGRRLAQGSVIALIAAGFTVWANAHGGFIVGLGILALFVAAPRSPGAAAEADAPPFRLRFAMIAAAAIGS